MSHDLGMAKDRLCEFLSRVTAARWRRVPKTWNDEFRQSLNDNLVTIGWGGVIQLADAGKEKLADWH